MNINFIPMILTGCLSLMILTFCGPHEQKADDAFERVKKERILSKDSNIISKAIIPETQIVKKTENQDEWTLYKIETGKKIHTNENIIKEIKRLPNANANMLIKVENLEKSNNDLRIKMDEYNEEMKVKWEKFKLMMNHDVNEIGIELKAMKLNNKK